MENLFKQNVNKSNYKLVGSSEKRFAKVISEIRFTDKKIKRPSIVK